MTDFTCNIYDSNMTSNLHGGNSFKGLPHYRYLVPSSPERKKPISSIPRPKSDPNLFKPASRGPRSTSVPIDEPGVHGGEYTVRPNMEESMTFLKKLFTHQKT